MISRRPVQPRPCARCGEVFKPQSNRVDKRYCSMRCYNEVKRAQLVGRVCAECGARFEVPRSEVARGGGKFCSRDCWRAHPKKSPAKRPEVADKIAAAKLKHGRSTGRRQRQLENAGVTLKHKGESCCRNCGRTKSLHLHHIIPRSMWRHGILLIDNTVTLCAGCHLGWHNRRVMLHREMLTAAEWMCVSSASLLGQSVTAWLDERYPSQGHGPLEAAA